jgi:hypothetical protein
VKTATAIFAVGIPMPEPASIGPAVIEPASIRPAVFKPSAITAVMVETGVIKTSTVEIGAVVPFENGAVVLEVYAIPVVTVPGGVIIIDVSREIGFAHSGVGVIAAIIDWRRLFINGCRLCVDRLLLIYYRRRHRRSDYVDPPAGYAKSNMCIYIDLGVAFGSDETRGCNGGEDG